MDTPKRAVSWLESFPPDIWGYFAYCLSGEQLGRLMMTGAMFLCQLLKSPRVVKSINLGQDFIVFKSLPRLLNDFASLDELLINSRTYDWSHLLDLKLAEIPSGVRKLELSGFSTEVATNLFDDAIGALNLATHLLHLEVLDLSTLNIADYSWIAHSPQSLTDLRLNRWNGRVELPSSLVHFFAFEVNLSTDSYVAKLPTYLESFVVQSELTGHRLLAPLLPASTRKLSLGPCLDYSSVSRSSRDLLEQLPKSLTSFIVPRSPELDFETDPGSISILASTLTELDVLPEFPCGAWSLLPQKLSKLSFGVHESHFSVASNIVDDCGVHQTLQSIPFDTLPRSLTRFELFWPSQTKYLCGPPPASVRSYFPPQLTYLKISNVQLCPETAELLPSSLTYLDIINLCERVCERLPKGLKTLISSQALVSPNLFKFLPKSLNSLYLSIHSGHGKRFDYNAGEAIFRITEDKNGNTTPSKKNVPWTLFVNRNKSRGFDWKDSTLPPTLTYLHLDAAPELGDSFLSHHQLPNLLELNLGLSEQVSDLSIPLLSSHLITLNLWSSSKIRGKSFEFLSRSLTSLNLRTSESIFDGDIQHLPRTLKRVNLGSAIHLTDLCVPHLPPHLEKLNLECNANITTSSFPLFPYPIRSPHLILTVMLANWDIWQGAVCKHPPRQRDWSIQFP